MNRRSFVGATLAGFGGLFCPQKAFPAVDEELPYTVEEITEFTETRCTLPESLPSLIAEGRGYRNSGLFIGKGRNIYTGELIEVHPFCSANEAAKRIHYHCTQPPTRDRPHRRPQ